MMNLNPWELDLRNQGFESQLFGRAQNDVQGIDALAPHDDAVIYSKRPSPQSRSPIGTVVERDYSPLSSPSHIDTLFRPSYQSVEFHRSLSPCNPSSMSPALSPRVTGASPRTSISPGPPSVQSGVSPRSLSNSLAGLTLNPPMGHGLSHSPRSLTPGSASPLPSPNNSNRSPRLDDQFDLELSGEGVAMDYAMFGRDPAMSQQQSPQSRHLSSPPMINLVPPSGHSHREPSMVRNSMPHYGGRLSPSITEEDQPAFISSASPFLPTVADVSYISASSSSDSFGIQHENPGQPTYEHQSFGEHPYGEYPSRTLFVRNIHSSVDDEELRQLFGTIGPITLPIRSMYTQCKHRGFVMISYYDLRDAKAAMHHLQNKVFHGRNLDIHYSIPKDNPSEKDQNQGTLVVFNLPPSITNEELILVFSEYGEVKEVRHTPNKKHHRFIEFYDIRHAEKAMKSLNKTEIKGKKIKIEPSRAGSPSMARRASHQIQPTIQHQASSAPQLTGVIHGFDPREDEVQGGQALPPHSYGGAYGGASSYGGGSRGGYSPDLGAGVEVEPDYPLSPLEYMNGSSPNGSYNDVSFSDYGTTRLSRYYASPPAVVPRFSLGSLQPSEPVWGRPSMSGGSSPITSPGSLSPRSPRSPRSTSPNLGIPPQMMGMPPGGPSPLDLLGNGLTGMGGNPGGALAKGSRGRHRSENSNDHNQFVLNLEAVRNGSETRTTLMIKNIPNKYSQKMLLAAVDELHKGQYDFFYLPIDFKNKCNVGYAFINFIDCKHIISFHEEFHGKKWEKFNSEKICAITYARIQGKMALIAHFQNSSLMCEDRKCRPIIFHSDGPLMGEQERFPVSSAVRQRRKEERKATDVTPINPQGFLE